MITKNITPFTKWVNGTKTLTTTRAQLTTLSTPCRSVVIRSNTANTGKVYVGSDNVTSSNAAIVLNATDYIEIEIDDISKVYLSAEVDNEGVTYHYVI